MKKKMKILFLLFTITLIKVINATIQLLKVDFVRDESNCPTVADSLGGRRPYWEPGCWQETPNGPESVAVDCSGNTVKVHSGSAGCTVGNLQQTLSIGSSQCQLKNAGYSSFSTGNYSFSCVNRPKGNMIRYL